MRIVVSGTHGSGKSALVADFAHEHPEYVVLADLFETGDSIECGDAGAFAAHLRFSAGRLLQLPPSSDVIAERGPIDYLAYLDALEMLGRSAHARTLFRGGVSDAAAAMRHVDLLVVLPLDEAESSSGDDPHLRSAMNESLLALTYDPDLIGEVRVAEITGDRASRLAQLNVQARLGDDAGDL